MDISSVTKLLVSISAIALIILLTITLGGLSNVEQAIEGDANPQKLMDTIDSASSLIWFVFFFTASAVIGFGIFFYRIVVSPIQALKAAIIQNDSKLDLTRTIDIKADGEVGDIVNAYNQLLKTVCKSLQNVEDTIFELTEMTEAVDTSARNVVRNSQLQTDASANMSKTIDRVVNGISLVTEQTYTAKNNTAEALEAAAAGTVDIMNTVRGIEIISDSVEKASQQIIKLRDDSDSISDMAVVIHQIADQTNLLALNAAIEAARAGDQGRGFAVVADEVRGLAQRTAASTQEISKLVIRMQEGTQKAVENISLTESEVKKGVENAEKAGMSIDRINQGSETASTTVQTIYDSMQDQQESSEHISSRVEQIAQISKKNSTSSATTAESIRAIADRSRKLLTVLDHFNYHTGIQKVKLRVADPLGDDHPAVKALQYMSDLLKERTNNRIVLTVNSGGTHGNDTEVFEKLQTGRVDMMRSNPAILNDAIPETLLLSLPFLFKSSGHMHKVMDGAPGQSILDACSRANLIGLAFYDSGARSIYSNTPIKSLSDMAGIRLRVMPSSLWSAVAKAMGAEPVKVGMNEIVSAQKMGLIDAAENNLPTFDDFKQHEGFSYFSQTEHAIVPELLLFSKKTWDKLTHEDQELIKQAAKDSVPEMRRLWNEAEAQAKNNSTKAGVTFINNVNKESFQTAMVPVYNKLITTPSLKALLKEIQKA